MLIISFGDTILWRECFRFLAIYKLFIPDTTKKKQSDESTTEYNSDPEVNVLDFTFVYDE